MKTTNKIISAILTLCLTLSLSAGLLTPIISYAADDTVYIKTAEEFIEFSKNCSLDSWSKGKSFALGADISLEGVDFQPIPFFSGSFDGQGHKINGIDIHGSFAPAGLFSILSTEGVVKNLTVEGGISPSGEKCYVGGIVGDNRGRVYNCEFLGTVIGKGDVGGIVGINRISGSVEGCYVSGEIIGDSRTGGIAGTNIGVISSCENNAKINTISITPTITLDELNSALTLDITKLPTINNIARTDSGGIAGYSCGMILGSKNLGEVGYLHIGYNAGGIVGRTCGHLLGNENHAPVFGRKDVGGIAGQVEPYISYDLSEDLLALLKSEMDNLHLLIGDAADSIDKSSATISARLSTIISLLGSASDSIDSISGGITDWGEGVIGEVNRLSIVLAETLDRISIVTEQLPELSSELAKALESMEKCLAEMEDVSEISREALTDLNLSLEDMESAISLLGEGAEKMEKGLISLKDSVKTDDADGIKNALKEISDGMSQIAKAISSMSDTSDKVSEVLGDISSLGDFLSSFDELGTAFGEMSSSLSGLSDGMTKISDGIIFISANLTVDVDKAMSGIEMIGQGLSKMVDASVSIEDSIAHLRDAIDHVNKASVELDEAMVHLKNAVGSLKRAADLCTDILVEVDGLIDYLASVDPVQIPTPDDSTTNDADKLFTTISSLESNLNRLNSEIKNVTGDVTDIVRQINDSFSRMMNTVVSAIYGLSDLDSSYDDNVTPEDVDGITSGKIFNCTNYGRIYGDKNVGGIGGVMGIEYSIDPEDDLTAEISITQKRQYKLKAVIHACENLGEVISKRDCVGGIVGRADMGLVYESESYSKVSSESGSFVGGIAGISGADIMNCYTKSLLYGKKYVGGILGSGVNEDKTGDSSLISGCISIVSIESFSQYGGAICGVNAGVFENNCFISEGLQGIDRVSYAGKAEPITYEELMKRRSIPTRLYDFKLTFIADGEVLSSYDFEYGVSFDSSVFPNIPVKNGYYGYWDRENLENLTFDTVVSVVYRPYTGSIGSDETRNDGRDIIIVEGSFKDGERIVLTENMANASGLEIKNGLFYIATLLESYIVSIPDDGVENIMRFLPDVKNFDIYVKQNGIWTKVDADKMGSYSIFSVDGEQIELAIVSYSVNVLTVVLLGAFVLLACAAIIVTVIIKRKRRMAGYAQSEEYEEFEIPEDFK